MLLLRFISCILSLVRLKMASADSHYHDSMPWGCTTLSLDALLHRYRALVLIVSDQSKRAHWLEPPSGYSSIKTCGVHVRWFPITSHIWKGWESEVNKIKRASTEYPWAKSKFHQVLSAYTQMWLYELVAMPRVATEHEAKTHAEKKNLMIYSRWYRADLLSE